MADCLGCLAFDVFVCFLENLHMISYLTEGNNKFHCAISLGVFITFQCATLPLAHLLS